MVGKHSIEPSTCLSVVRILLVLVRTLTKPCVWEEIVVSKINFLLLLENIAHMQKTRPLVLLVSV